MLTSTMLSPQNLAPPSQASETKGRLGMREEELKNAKEAGAEAKAAELAELKGKLGRSLKANLVQMQEQIQKLEQLPAADEEGGRACTDNADEPPECHAGWLSNRGWLSYRGWRDMYERIEPLQAIELSLADCEPEVQAQSEVSLGSTQETPREKDGQGLTERLIRRGRERREKDLPADRTDGEASLDEIYAKDNLMWVTEFGTLCTPKQSFAVLEAPRTPPSTSNVQAAGHRAEATAQTSVEEQSGTQMKTAGTERCTKELRRHASSNSPPLARLQSPRTTFISLQEEGSFQEESSERFKTGKTTDSQSKPRSSFEFKLESPLPLAGISTFRRPQRSTFGHSNAACRFLGDNSMHINIDMINAGTSSCRFKSRCRICP